MNPVDTNALLHLLYHPGVSKPAVPAWTVAQLVSSNVCMPVAIPLMLCGSDTLKLDKCNSASTWQGKVYFNRTDHHAFASPHKPYEM